MPTKGFPELKTHFAMMGAPHNVMLKPLVHFGHNYNYVSRAAMYGWLNQHLKLGCKTPVVEEDYPRLTAEELSVWDQAHPKPESGPEFERKLLRYVTQVDEKQLQPAVNSLAQYREVVGGAVDILIGRNLSEVGVVEFKELKRAQQGDYEEVAGLLQNQARHEALPVIVLHPKQAKNRTVIWVDEAGKAGLFDGEKPSTEIQKLLQAGTTVIGVDLLMQGDFLADGKPVTQTRRVKNPREFAGYTFGYNHALFAQRVHDILTVVKYARSLEKNTHLALAGLGGAGPWVVAAVAQARDAVNSAAVETGGFRFGKILDLHDVNFLPGGAKYRDMPGMIALCAPVRLWLAGEGAAAPEVAQAIYAKADAAANLSTFNGDRSQTRAAALDWLLK